jgi:hypothetical protein
MELELEVEVNPKIDIEKVNRLVELYSVQKILFRQL